MLSAKDVAREFVVKGERIFIMPEQVVLDDQLWRTVFFYRGREILGIPLEDPRMTGGLVVDVTGRPSNRHRIAERVGKTSLIYLQMTKPASIAAYRNVPGVARKVVDDFESYREAWISSRRILDFLDSRSSAEGLELVESIIDLMKEVATSTTWIDQKLGEFLDQDALPYDVIKRLFKAHNRYQEAGRSANEKMVRLNRLARDLHRRLDESPLGRGISERQVLKSARSLLKSIATTTSKASPESFNNTLRSSVEREIELFLEGYRVQLDQ